MEIFQYFGLSVLYGKYLYEDPTLLRCLSPLPGRHIVYILDPPSASPILWKRRCPVLHAIIERRGLMLCKMAPKMRQSSLG